MTFTLPASLRSYLTEDDIRTAIDDLAARKHESVPRDTSWDDLPAYYDSVAAVWRIKADAAVALASLWDAVWGDTVSEWDGILPSDQTDKAYGSPVTVDTCWTSDEYVRCFTRRGYRPIWLLVGFDPTKCWIGFADDRPAADLISQFEGWVADNEDDVWIFVYAECAITAPKFDVEPLRIAASSLMRTIEIMEE